MVTWNQDAAAHLLRRTGFGPTFGQVQSVYALGQAGAIDWLLKWELTPDTVLSRVNPLGFGNYPGNPDFVRATWVFQFMASARPLQARLTWFWHGHFTGALSSCDVNLMQTQINTWRANAGGSFRTFLHAVYNDAAMLRYLNNAENDKRHPNENFARESMELFTVGSGHYTETDVREWARALTGWRVTPAGVPYFDNTLFDAGSKTILGSTGNFNADNVVDLLCQQPQTRERICTKLYRHFVADVVDPMELATLEASWVQSDGNLRTVMRTLLQLPGFWSSANRGGLIKSAVDYASALALALGLPLNSTLIYRILAWSPGMGQIPFEPPTVAGYPQGLAQVGSSQMVARAQYAYHCVYGLGGAALAGRLTAGLTAPVAPSALVAQVTGRLCMAPVSPATTQLLQAYVGSTAVSATLLPNAALGVAFLLACSPEYQMK